MTLQDIISNFGTLSIVEKRDVTDSYTEFVIHHQDIHQWDELLTRLLGPAQKLSGKKPTANDLQLTEEYGGIYDQQTLFKKEVDGQTVIAMFWPWGDQSHTTIKIAVLN